MKRVFVGQTEEMVYVLVNPVIEEKSEETETAVEGCLSFPGVGVEVERHMGVVVAGRDEEGRPVRHEAESEIARMMQHEVDHLDGVLMLDRTGPEERRRALKEWRERLLGVASTTWTSRPPTPSSGGSRTWTTWPGGATQPPS